jgi:hypothetical protein
VYNDNQIYETVSTIRVRASMSTVDGVINRFIHDLGHNPENLFDNLLQDIAKHNTGNDILSVKYKNCSYDAKKDLYTEVLDIFVGNTRLSDTEFSGRMNKKTKPNLNSESTFDMVYVNPVLKKANFRILVKKEENGIVEITFIGDFKFGWLFNLFFSMKSYQNIAEWRIDKFMQNLNREILLQEKNNAHR